MSTERVIIDNAVADVFAQKLAKRVAALPVGNPNEGEFVIGSVVGPATVQRVQHLVSDAVKQGAKVIAGGDVKGTIMAGIVVDHVTPAMTLFREESFGPQVSITRVNSVDEAVKLANDSEYGLSAAVFTRDLALGIDIAKRIESGICHINGPTVHDEAQMPFGGVKSSGYGRFGGKGRCRFLYGAALDHPTDHAATLPFLSRALLSAALFAAGLQPALADDDSVSCQAAGWDMARELKAYAGDASRVAAGGATWNTPIVWADTLYALTLRPQSDVHFAQESPNAPRAAASMAGLARFTVLAGGRYRVTVNTALWIDAVDATSIVAPSNYITWHRCPRYRKSVEYQLMAGQTVVLQFSGATAPVAEVTIESIAD